MQLHTPVTRVHVPDRPARFPLNCAGVPTFAVAETIADGADRPQAPVSAALALSELDGMRDQLFGLRLGVPTRQDGRFLADVQVFRHSRECVSSSLRARSD
jgi:hypothetical protein